MPSFCPSFRPHARLQKTYTANPIADPLFLSYVRVGNVIRNKRELLEWTSNMNVTKGLIDVGIQSGPFAICWTDFPTLLHSLPKTIYFYCWEREEGRGRDWKLEKGTPFKSKILHLGFGPWGIHSGPFAAWYRVLKFYHLFTGPPIINHFLIGNGEGGWGG